MDLKPLQGDPAKNWPRRGKAMSEEAYHKLEQRDPVYRYEYIQGRAYIVGGNTVGYGRIKHNILSLLDQLLTSPCEATGSIVQVLLRNPEDDRKHFVYPDVTISCTPEDNRMDNDLIQSPRVVFEVLASDTEWRDRVVKFRAYQNCPTIQEIVLVSLYAPHVEIWQRDEQDITLWHPRLYNRDTTVDFASIDVHVKIEELYRRLDYLFEGDEEE